MQSGSAVIIRSTNYINTTKQSTFNVLGIHSTTHSVPRVHPTVTRRERTSTAYAECSRPPYTLGSGGGGASGLQFRSKRVTITAKKNKNKQ